MLSANDMPQGIGGRQRRRVGAFQVEKELRVGIPSFELRREFERERGLVLPVAESFSLLIGLLCLLPITKLPCTPPVNTTLP